jgi:hypothetical protein
MPLYLLAILSTTIAGFLVLCTGSLFVKFNKDLACGARGRVSDAGISLALGVIATLLLVINLNLWIPGRWIYAVVTLTALFGLIRLLEARRRGGKEVLWWVLLISAIVLGASCVTSVRVDAAHYWLVETSNHDTLFYFEGAHWAAKHPIYVGPEAVSEVLNLGGCRLGAVYIGNDCPVYRGGSFSLLGLALAFGGAGSANSMLIASALGVLLLAVGLLPLASENKADWGVKAIAWRLFFGFVVLVVYFSPTLLAAAINSNVATTFGAAGVAMVLALSLHNDDVWWRRPLMAGLGASLAAHTYGEAAASAVIFAACSTAFSAWSARSWTYFWRASIVCAAAFMISSNVLLIELIQSAKDVEGIAKGGAWEGLYLHASPWTWLAAPFAGMVVNGNPYVSGSMLVVGWIISAFVVVGSLFNRRACAALAALLVVTGLLISFVEIRDYAYGEHKIVQMFGTAACVLAAGLIIRYTGGSRAGSGNVLAFVRISFASLLFALLILAIYFQALPAMSVVEAWKGIHGLSLDFKSAFEVDQRDGDWVIDDSAVDGVERFQKSHYAAYLIHESGGRVRLPRLDNEGMRGGYARKVLGDTLSHAKKLGRLVQFKSHAGVISPFVYLSESTSEFDEYNLVDLTKAEPVAAVSGWGWLPCRAGACPVASGFEIEAVSWAPRDSVCGIRIYADHVAEYGSRKVVMHVDDAVSATFDLSPEGIFIPLKPGWQRLRFVDPSDTPGALWEVRRVGMACESEADRTNQR